MSFVAPSPSSAIWRARSTLSASSVSTSASNSGVPSRTGAFAASPFARAKTASFVLMSPSTVSMSKLVCTARERAACRARALTPEVGRDEREHRRHLGRDHPRALREGGERRLDVADAHRPARELHPRVGGPDRLCGRRDRGPARGRQARRSGGEPGDRQADADDPRRGAEHRLGADVQRARHGGADGARVVDALRPGERVRVAAVGDDGAHPVGGHARGSVEHRARSRRVAREAPGRGARHLAEDEREVLARGLDAAVDAGVRKSSRGLHDGIPAMARRAATRRGPSSLPSRSSGSGSAAPGPRRPSAGCRWRRRRRPRPRRPWLRRDRRSSPPRA